MNWIDIASIVFVCVTMNHLGLITAIEKHIGYEFPILDCVKCSSFWLTLIYVGMMSGQPITTLAVSFLASYIAIWLELLEGYIDTLYLKIYGKIYTTSDDTASADTNNGDSESTVSEL
jgi:hypothetical protein